jgi:dihydroorotate dehydrogenase electron transfer subunit
VSLDPMSPAPAAPAAAAPVRPAQAPPWAALPRRRLLKVTANERLGAYTLLKVADPDGPAPSPGQFTMLAAAERWGGGEDERPYLARAFSVARWHDGEAHYLLEDVGPGTKRLCELKAGEGVWALGPLGRGFSAPADGRRTLLVGGGVGIAPLAILQDELDAAAPPSSPGTRARPQVSPAMALLGFRDGERAVGASLLKDAIVASDDGSVGHAGFVTELLGEELRRDKHATVYACGPAPMLEAVRAMCERTCTPAQLALEAGMACGFGACYGCVVARRGGGYLRVCVDGPVIDAGELERVDEHAGAPA